MAATIIYPDIVKYTKRLQEELGIRKEKYSEYIFRENGLAVNPYKGCEILFFFGHVQLVLGICILFTVLSSGNECINLIHIYICIDSAVEDIDFFSIS